MTPSTLLGTVAQNSPPFFCDVPAIFGGLFFFGRNFMAWPHFSQRELNCRCGCGRAEMSPAFMVRLEQLRVTHNKPMVVTSAFRCQAHNANISSTGPFGPHPSGMAVDIQVSGHDAYELLHAAIGHGFSGIGLMQHGPHANRFIHLDLMERALGCPKPWIWTYPSG